MVAGHGVYERSISTAGTHAKLVLRWRTFDAGETQHFPCQKLHKQPDTRDTRPFWYDEHAERHRRRSIVRQDSFEPAFGKQIVHQPKMSGADAAPSKIGFPCGQPVIDPEASTEGHGVGFAVRPFQRERIASGNVRHADAFDTCQFLGRGRPSMPCQIFWRPDEDAPAQAERPQSHGTVGQRAEADCYVHALAHEVYPLISQMQIDRDFRVAILEGENQTADISDAERSRAGYTNRAGRCLACAPRFVASLFHQTQNLDSICVVAAAFLGQRDAPRRSAQQNHAQRFLQFMKMPRDAGLTDVHLARDGREVPPFRDADKGAHTFERYIRSIHFSALSYPKSLYTGLIGHRLAWEKANSNKQVPAMNVLIVFAHPDPRSLNASLRDVAVQELESGGHEVRVSDLYAMGWKSEIDRADFPALSASERLLPATASRNAFTTDTLTQDVKDEITKLIWADVLILQFPLWWFAMPAILKGWVDRVYAYGFAYGVGEHSDKRWGDRYGEGTLNGKRAMLIVTAGGWEEHYAPRGVNGPIDDLLFPINHGILYYPGYDVLPPFVTYSTDRFNEARFETAADDLRQRMRSLEITSPIPYRQQNGGDYVIPSMQLRPGLEPAGTAGFSLHLKQAE